MNQTIEVRGARRYPVVVPPPTATRASERVNPLSPRTVQQ